MRRSSIVAFLVAATFGAAPSFAGDAPAPTRQKSGVKAKKRSGATPAPTAPAKDAPSAGMVVFVDPVTHKVRQPDAEEIGKLLASARVRSASTVQPEVKQLPGGGKAVLLDSSFETYVVATKAPDGTVTTGCVEGSKGADSPAPSTGAEATDVR